LCEVYNASGTAKTRKHSTAAGPAAKLFALEQEYLGEGITTSYASGDQVILGIFHSGDEVYAKLAANAPAIVAGDLLESAGDGTLRKVLTTNLVDLTGTLTGTANGSLADIAATAGSCAGGAEPSAAQVDTAIATAVASIVTGTNEQLKEIQTVINAMLPQGVGNPLALALEAVDNSAVAAEAFIRVMLL
jgi:hypothetical protein